jgi:hypothetical protein
LIKLILSGSDDKSLAKEIAQNIQKFYFGDKPLNFEAISSIMDVSQCYCWCLYTCFKLVLCDCETWSLAKRADHASRAN